MPGGASSHARRILKKKKKKSPKIQPEPGWMGRSYPLALKMCEFASRIPFSICKACRHLLDYKPQWDNTA